MQITMDVATLRTVYDTAADVKDVAIDLSQATIVISIDDGSGAVVPDSTVWRPARTEYLRRALTTLIKGNKAFILNAMKSEIKADLDLIKSSADVPA